jgi:hypothetical protein
MAEEISPLENHGWWMEQLRKDAKANRPEALRLADALQQQAVWEGHYGPSYLRDLLPEAATELRRLHAENERLHQINQSHEMKLSVRGYEIQIADLKAANLKLAGAIDMIRATLNGGNVDDLLYIINTALAEHRGNHG